jgi:hypothetical protein
MRKYGVMHADAVPIFSILSAIISSVDSYLEHISVLRGFLIPDSDYHTSLVSPSSSYDGAVI